MNRYDPERLSDTLRWQESSSTAGPHSQYSGEGSQISEISGTESNSCADAGKQADAAFTEMLQGLPQFPTARVRQENLACIDGSVPVGRLPQGARFGFLKRPFLRMLRIITGRQMDFNWHTAYVLHQLNEHAAQSDRALSLVARALDALRQTHPHDLVRESAAIRKELGHEVERAASAAAAMALQIESLEHRLSDALSQVQNLQGQMRASVEDQQRQLEMVLTDLRKQAQACAEQGEALRSSQRRMLAALSTEPSAGQRSNGPSAGHTQGGAQGDATPQRLFEDLEYQLYEDAWRGSVESIRQAQEGYADLLQPHLEALPADKRTILDIGCGRGEFLQVLRSRGLRAKGVDANSSFARAGSQQGLDITQGDAILFLSDQSDAAFGAICAFQVLEHFAPADLRSLIRTISLKLAPGGVALFETLNPAVFSAHQWFHMDLTHQCFLPARTLQFLAECAGLEHVETRMIHPVEDYARLQETGDAAEAENIRRLNALLYGPQDYFILLRKPLEVPNAH